MPNVTPVWNLPYPCPGDVVTAADFLNLDVALDEALTALDAQSEVVRNRPFIRWYRDTPTVVATGAGIVLTPTSVDFQTNWPTFNVAPMTGLYHIALEMDAGDNSAATLTSESMFVTFSTYPGVIQVVRYNESLVDIGMPRAITGVALLNAGETITCQYAPTGTAGNVTFNFAGFQARLVFPT